MPAARASSAWSAASDAEVRATSTPSPAAVDDVGDGSTAAARGRRRARTRTARRSRECVTSPGPSQRGPDEPAIRASIAIAHARTLPIAAESPDPQRHAAAPATKYERGNIPCPTRLQTSAMRRTSVPGSPRRCRWREHGEQRPGTGGRKGASPLPAKSGPRCGCRGAAGARHSNARQSAVNTANASGEARQAASSPPARRARPARCSRPRRRRARGPRARGDAACARPGPARASAPHAPWLIVARLEREVDERERHAEPREERPSPATCGENSATMPSARTGRKRDQRASRGPRSLHAPSSGSTRPSAMRSRRSSTPSAASPTPRCSP